jgi:hypothetical protein
MSEGFFLAESLSRAKRMILIRCPAFFTPSDTSRE